MDLSSSGHEFLFCQRERVKKSLHRGLAETPAALVRSSLIVIVPGFPRSEVLWVGGNRDQRLGVLLHYQRKGPGRRVVTSPKAAEFLIFLAFGRVAEKAVGVKEPSIRRSERDTAAFADGFDAVFGRFFACGDPPDCTMRTSGSRQSGTPSRDAYRPAPAPSRSGRPRLAAPARPSRWLRPAL